MLTNTTSRIALFLLTAVLAMPASALAASQRIATPTGSGSTCSQVSPCGLVTAVNSAAPGDEVIVAGNQGSYGTAGTPISTPLVVQGLGQLHGAAGQPMPVIYSSAATAVTSSNGALSDLDLEDATTNANAIAMGDNITADHLIAHGSHGTGCRPGPAASIIDSVCAGGGFGIAVNFGISGAKTMTLRNVTSIGTSFGITIDASTVHEIVNASNVIARGGTRDVNAVTNSGGTLAFNFDHSNYATTQTDSGSTITPAGTGTNQTAAPAFVDAAAGDFREAAGSPTIDAGLTDPANSATDFEGDPRATVTSFSFHFGTTPSLGQTTPTRSLTFTDIGADQRAAAPGVTTAVPSGVTLTGATLNGLVNPNGAPNPLAESAGLTGLSPGTTYYFQLAANNQAGSVTSPTATFTTAPNSTPPPTKATISSLNETNRVFAAASATTSLTGRTTARRHKRGTVFSFRLDQAATVKLAIQLRTHGRKVGRTCKADSRRLRHKARCTRYVGKGTLTRTGHAGLNRVAFSGRIGRRALKPGSYRALFTARNAAGTSSSRTLPFTIVKS